MPVIRTDDQGNEVQKEKRKKQARHVAIITATGAVVSTVLFFYHSPDMGIFIGLWSIGLAVVTNLIDD